MTSSRECTALMKYEGGAGGRVRVSSIHARGHRFVRTEVVGTWVCSRCGLTTSSPVSGDHPPCEIVPLLRLLVLLAWGQE